MFIFHGRKCHEIITQKRQIIIVAVMVNQIILLKLHAWLFCVEHSCMVV